MAKVTAKNAESFEKLLRRFKRAVAEDLILEECKERQFYKSKGQLAKEARNVAIRRQQRKVRKQNERLNTQPY